jgi:chromosomal replication initiator protein
MQAWDNFLKVLEHELGQETVQRWLHPLKIVRFDACNLFLEANDTFQVHWFEEHVRTRAKNFLKNNNNTAIQVHLNLPSAPAKLKKGLKKKQEDTPAFIMNFDELDTTVTLDNFIVSEPNRIVHRLLTQTVGKDQEPPELCTFNPIYLHGPTGTGKTHLLMAVTKALKDKGLQPLYVTAKTFTDHVINAIRAGEMYRFREAYRNVDVLIVDDAHVFSRKGATQEELFHTFNFLHLAGTQMIFSANCSPRELQMIEPRLISRFEWGIALPLEPPSEAEKKLILQSRLKAFKTDLHPKVLTFLMETFTSSITHLCNAVEALILRNHMRHNNSIPSDMLTVPMAKQLLTDMIDDEEKAAVTPEKILNATANYFGIRVDDIMGKAQSRDCVTPRQIAMYLCRSQLKLPYMRIGEMFQRDHSTVMSSVKQVTSAVEKEDQEIHSALATIQKDIYGSPQ